MITEWPVLKLVLKIITEKNVKAISQLKMTRYNFQKKLNQLTEPERVAGKVFLEVKNIALMAK